jgi:hypothetical protein
LAQANSVSEDHPRRAGLPDWHPSASRRRRFAALRPEALIKELHAWFGGRLLVRLKDGRTELQVARDRAADVRSKPGV